MATVWRMSVLNSDTVGSKEREKKSDAGAENHHQVFADNYPYLDISWIMRLMSTPKLLSLIRNLNNFQTSSIALCSHVRLTSVFLRWEKDVITTVLQYHHLFYIRSS